MKYEEMTPRMKRLSKEVTCPICNNPIVPYEDVQIIKINYGKRVLHSFFHTTCILNSLLSSQLETSSREGVKYAEAE